ncbi:MAG: hypothetical protein KDK91_23490 [Gammaproteobacteria bacterium]|nr:hypothetical protein [Gammaproteobacteria bacterium]
MNNHPSRFTVARITRSLLVVAATLCWMGPASGEGFDNPTRAGIGCIALDEFRARPTVPLRSPPTGRQSQAGHSASAVVENLCGRTVEMKFCFLLASGDADKRQACSEQLVRPSERARVTLKLSELRIIGSEYEWRYLPVR